MLAWLVSNTAAYQSSRRWYRQPGASFDGVCQALEMELVLRHARRLMRVRLGWVLLPAHFPCVAWNHDEPMLGFVVHSLFARHAAVAVAQQIDVV